MVQGRGSVELVDVPFFPQDRYQCGPAALATVLSYSGVDTAPEDLVSRVYLPERRGSLQIELKAVTRNSGRLAYEIQPDADALRSELAAGRPVLVLQNLGFAWLPRWHYAVVVGFDAERQRVLLRSGTTKRREEPLGRFLRSWSLADDWGLVALVPGELPSSGSAARYLQTVLDSAALLPAELHSRALLAGVTVWPDDADLSFAAANQLRQQQQIEGAAELYRKALRAQPQHAGALNNYADLLHAAGCQSAARRLIDRAVGAIPEGSPLLGVVAATRAEIYSASVPGLAGASGAENSRNCARLAPSSP